MKLKYNLKCGKPLSVYYVELNNNYYEILVSQNVTEYDLFENIFNNYNEQVFNKFLERFKNDYFDYTFIKSFKGKTIQKGDYKVKIDTIHTSQLNEGLAIVVKVDNLNDFKDSRYNLIGLACDIARNLREYEIIEQ